jgi:hypothetical protein
MPSHTAASALVKLHSLGGLPWVWPAWQELTGIRHELFPEDDRLLPKGWTRADANDIKSYFDQYNAIDTEDNKIKFAVATRDGRSVPGRKKWSDFVSKSWHKWGIHELIIDGLKKQGVHPVMLLVQEKSMDHWPKSDTYIPMALDAIGMSIFGIEAFNGADVLGYNIRKCLTIFVQRSWSRIREQVQRDKGRLDEIEKSVMESFEGKFIYLFANLTAI